MTKMTIHDLMSASTLQIDPGKDVSEPFVTALNNTSCVTLSNDAIRENIAIINIYLASLKAREKKALTVENIRAQTSRLRRQALLARHHLEMAILGYRTYIDLRFLKDTDSKGLPIFGIAEIKKNGLFSFSKPKPVIFSLHVTNSWEGPSVRFTPPDLPPEIQQMYLKSAEEMAKVCSRGEEVFISTEYTGSMPDDLRHAVEQALSSRLFESAWLIFEAPNWVIGKKIITRPDPIIVVRDLSQGSPIYFFLGIFDPTHHELLAVRNNTQHPSL